VSDAARPPIYAETKLSTYQENKRGIIALTTGCALFAVNDTLTKLTAIAHPTGEVLFGRGIVSLICLGVVLTYSHQLSWLRHSGHPFVILRALLDSGANIFFILALSHMRIADLMAVNLVSPLLLTMLMALFYRESVGWRRWTAILVGFAGVICIVRPTPSSMNIWALVGVAAAMCSALRDTTIRKIEPKVPTLAISFVSILAVTLMAPLQGLLIEEQWDLPGAKYMIYMAVAGLVLSVGSNFAVSAFRNVDITVVAPFRYSLLLWGAISGYLVFGEVSDVISLIGSLLIVGSGLYTLHRERVRHRELSATSGIH
jgi:drug/metabolite transporter (DMT)-like permease